MEEIREENYRLFVIKGVQMVEEAVVVSFYNTVFYLIIEKVILAMRFHITWTEVIPGRRIFIQGKNGNSDAALVCPDSAKDIILVP